MSREITIELSKESVHNAIVSLMDYKNELKIRTKLFTERLAEVGINTAIFNNGGEFASYIQFSKNVKIDGDLAETQIVAKNTQLVTVEWDTGDAVVNPVLMTEFGSGWSARNDSESRTAKSGQGTFPGQKNAFNKGGWNWYVNGEKYHSYGSKAYAPMYHAYVEMVADIGRIANEVFGGTW